jgi:hypothetical protein
MIGFQFDAEDDLMKVMNLRVSETRTLRVTFGHLVDIWSLEVPFSSKMATHTAKYG